MSTILNIWPFLWKKKSIRNKLCMEIFISDNEKFIIFLLTNAWSIIKISRTFVSNYEDQYSLDDPPPACMHQFLQGWFLHHICYFDKPLNVVIVTISKTNRPTSIYFYLIAVYVVAFFSKHLVGHSPSGHCLIHLQ